MYKTINYCDNFLEYWGSTLCIYVIPGILLIWAMASLAARNPKEKVQSNEPKVGFFKQSLWVLIAMFGGMFVIEKSLHEEFKRHRIVQKAIAVWAVIVGIVTMLINGDNALLRNAYDTAVNGNTMEIYSGDAQLRAFPSYEIYKILSGIHSLLSLSAIAAYIWCFRPSPTKIGFKIRKVLGLIVLYFSYTVVIIIYTPYDLMMYSVVLLLSVLLLIDYRKKGNKEQCTIKMNSSETISEANKPEGKKWVIEGCTNLCLDKNIVEDEVKGDMDKQLDGKSKKVNLLFQKCKAFIWNKILKGISLAEKNKFPKRGSKTTINNRGKLVVRRCIGVAIAFLALFLTGLIYSACIFPKHCNRIDEQMVDTAMSDSTKVVEIAEWFLSNSEHWHHRNIIISIYSWIGVSGYYCDNDHQEIGEKILRENAENGYADAQFAYGMRFFKTGGWINKRYVENDWNAPQKLLKWFESAWNGEEIDLKYDLAYYVNISTFERAAYWLKKSADNGHADAAAYLGFFYEIGLGVKKDLLYSASLTRTAAERGSVFGIYRLGIEYSKGTIGRIFYMDDDEEDVKTELFRDTPNIKEAKRLWKIAADAGYEHAKVKYEKIYDGETW